MEPALTLATIGGVTAALVQIFKVAEVVPERFIPMLAVATGIILSLGLAGLVGTSLLEGILNGVVVGLISIGAYKVTTKTVLNR